MRESEYKTVEKIRTKQDPSVLEMAYAVFFNEGIVRSQQEFSTEILGMAPSYYSSMVARDRQPTKVVLYRVLAQICIHDFPGSVHKYKLQSNLRVLETTIVTSLPRFASGE